MFELKGSSSKYQDDGLVAAVNSEPATSSLEAAGTQHAATTVASKKSKSPGTDYHIVVVVPATAVGSAGSGVVYCSL